MIMIMTTNNNNKNNNNNNKNYLPTTSNQTGIAAELAEARKNAKYSQLMQSYLFVPLAFETMEPINAKGLAFLADLGSPLSQVSGDPRETSYFFQRLSVVIKRFNAVAFHSTFVLPDLDKDGHSIVNIAY